MRTCFRIAMLLIFGAWGMVGVSAHSAPKAVTLAAPALTVAVDDNMTPYRKLAEDTLKAFKAMDLPTARKKAKELEKAWDNNEKALKKASPAVWDEIDKAMDDFIKPLEDKAPDAAKVQTGYDAFIAKLKLGVKGGL
jgi:esterase/lipase